jgi:tRNA pseudouridine38-40 synthase
MKREARALVGRKDFTSFANVDPSRTCDAIRTVRRVGIRKEGPFVIITVEADGFLYKMVRTIAGTLLEVASGRFPPGSIARMLKDKDRRSAGLAAPAHGLYLETVKY